MESLIEATHKWKKNPGRIWLGLQRHFARLPPLMVSVAAAPLESQYLHLTPFGAPEVEESWGFETRSSVMRPPPLVQPCLGNALYLFTATHFSSLSPSQTHSGLMAPAVPWFLELIALPTRPRELGQTSLGPFP